MAISSVSNTDWYKILPNQPISAGSEAGDARARNTLHLSSQAKLINNQLKKETEKTQDDPKKDFIQVSSSIGRSTRLTGLSHNEAVALYRSIEAMS